MVSASAYLQFIALVVPALLAGRAVATGAWEFEVFRDPEKSLVLHPECNIKVTTESGTGAKDCTNLPATAHFGYTTQMAKDCNLQFFELPGCKGHAGRIFHDTSSHGTCVPLGELLDGDQAVGLTHNTVASFKVVCI